MRCTNPIFLPGIGAVPCGKCIACSENKQKSWAFRIMQEVRAASSAWFVTLTYNDDCVPLDETRTFPVVVKRDIQLWLKRLRKHVGRAGIRYFLCSEYGPKTFRPHYHAIILNLPFGKDIVYESIIRTWDKGYVTVSRVTPGRCYYVAKYVCMLGVLPAHLQSREYRPFFLCSRRLGIGFQWLSSNVVDSYRNNPRGYVVLPGGVKQVLPRYYRDKLYDDDMKAALAESVELLNIEDYNRKRRDYVRPTSLSDVIYPAEKQRLDEYEKRVYKKILKTSKI